jgi:hypothetical protein
MTDLPYLHSSTGEYYSLEKDGTYQIGSKSTDIVLNDASVKPLHAAIVTVGSRVMIRAENGEVLVNGHAISGMAALKPGDRVRIGNLDFEYTVQSGATSPGTQRTAPTSRHNTKRTPISLPGKASGFGDLGEAMFDEPEPPAQEEEKVSQPSQTQRPKTVPPPSPKSRSKHQPTPTSSQNTRTTPKSTQSGLSESEQRAVLTRYFAGGQIFREKVGGGVDSIWKNGRPQSGLGALLYTSGKILEAINDYQEKKAKEAARPAQYVDQAIHQTVMSTVDVARNEIGMVSTLRDPLVIYGPIFWRASGIPLENLCARRGDDGYVRFSAQRVSVLLLDENMMGIYTCHLDTIDKRIGYAQNSIYSYKDVTSITDQDTTIKVEMDDGMQEITAHAFRIVVPGDDLSITLNSPTIRDMFQGDAAIQPEHKKSLNIIRQLWLTKKQE